MIVDNFRFHENNFKIFIKLVYNISALIFEIKFFRIMIKEFYHTSSLENYLIGYDEYLAFIIIPIMRLTSSLGDCKGKKFPHNDPSSLRKSRDCFGLFPKKLLIRFDILLFNLFPNFFSSKENFLSCALSMKIFSQPICKCFLIKG